MTLSETDLLPVAPPALIKALELEIAKHAAGLNAQSEAKQAPADPLESAKPLIYIPGNETPPPPPASAPADLSGDLNAEPEMIPPDRDLPNEPPPNKPGHMGTCGRTMQRRLPEAGEFIDERGTIRPHGFWSPPKPAPKRRKLATLGSLGDVERELAKLYADYHHLRIDAGQFTRGVYGLSQLASIMRMASRSAAESAMQQPSPAVSAS